MLSLGELTLSLKTLPGLEASWQQPATGPQKRIARRLLKGQTAMQNGDLDTAKRRSPGDRYNPGGGRYSTWASSPCGSRSGSRHLASAQGRKTRTKMRHSTEHRVVE